ncbi:hypothetical protein B0H14DRAFT_2562833 [Mycena olivaceomarginata]|nr:hypothetical protein B0H14DRAFT_2562833 [Mycena olivaceomarginata]
MNGFDCPVRPTSSSNLFQILSVTNTVAATLKVNLSLMLCDENLSSLACCVSPSVFHAVLMNARRLASFKLQLFKAELLIDDDIYRHFTASFTAGTVATTVWSPTDIRFLCLPNITEPDHSIRHRRLNVVILQVRRILDSWTLLSNWTQFGRTLILHATATFGLIMFRLPFSPILPKPSNHSTNISHTVNMYASPSALKLASLAFSSQRRVSPLRNENSEVRCSRALDGCTIHGGSIALQKKKTITRTAD